MGKADRKMWLAGELWCLARAYSLVRHHFPRRRASVDTHSPPLQKNIILRAKLHWGKIVSFWHLRKIICVGTVCAHTRRRENNNPSHVHSHAMANQTWQQAGRKAVPAEGSREGLLQGSRGTQQKPAASRARTKEGRQRPRSSSGRRSGDGAGDTPSRPSTS